MNKEIINLKKLSILLIILPYLCFNYENIIYSSFFSYYKISLLFIFIIIIDFILKLLLSKLNYKSSAIMSLIVFFAVFIFFYSIYIITFIQRFFIEKYGILIRGRITIEVGLLLFVIILFYLRKKRVNFFYLNVYLLILSLVIIFTSVNKIKWKSVVDYKVNYLQITSINNVKPLILIIVDEYTSPDGLFNIYNDSSIYTFSNKLKNNGWKINNSFYSYETSTIHSLSSMFNFNLSLNGEYWNEGLINIGGKRLINSDLADSLENKKVDIINFGIFHFGKYPYLTPLYLYPTSFIEAVMINTIYYTLITNTGNITKEGFTQSFYPQEKHNKYIFENLNDTLSRIKNKKSFIYTHLFMPHYPFQYKPEFTLKNRNLINYKSYWNFTNKKLEGLIKTLTKENKYRVIISGDHGFRGYKTLNPNYTFTAIYGFDESSIKKIKSVQDLGSLINSGF